MVIALTVPPHEMDARVYPTSFVVSVRGGIDLRTGIKIRTAPKVSTAENRNGAPGRYAGADS